MELPVQYLNPVVLRCNRYDGYLLDIGEKYTPRTVYDYELEYYLRSDGGVIIDGRYTPFAAGEINLRKPGQLVEGVPPYDCYILCVDFIGNGARSPGYSFGTPEEGQPHYRSALLESLPDKLRPVKTDLIELLIRDIMAGFHTEGDFAFFQRKASTYYLFQEVFREVLESPASGSTAKIREAVRVIRSRFTEELSVEELVERSGLSRPFFHARFRKETGMTPGGMITYLRIEMAKNLLSITESEIGEIGALCGYGDRAYFSRIFHKQTGFSPSGFRERTAGPSFLSQERKEAKESGELRVGL